MSIFIQKKYFNKKGKLINKVVSKPCAHILPDHHCRNYEEENSRSSKFSKKHVKKEIFDIINDY